MIKKEKQQESKIFKKLKELKNLTIYSAKVPKSNKAIDKEFVICQNQNT